MAPLLLVRDALVSSSCFNQPRVSPGLVLLLTIRFLLIEQICSRTSQIYDLWTAIPILLQPRAFKAVECVADTLPAADDTLVLVVAEGAFIADPDEGRRSDVGVADGAFAIALVAETADCDAGLLAAHYQIGVMTRHVGGWRC